MILIKNAVATRVVTLSLFLIVSSIQTSFGDTGCPQIDPKNTDFDGMPLCPDTVKTTSAESVFRCARAQTTAAGWHAPTAGEGSHLFALLSAYQQSLQNGISSQTSSEIMQNADSLDLQVCRVKNDRVFNGVNEQDSFLIAYTKPKVTTYSGPFLMLREKGPSKIILMVPHDGSDGTNQATKVGFADTHTLVEISNGCDHGITHQSDFIDHMDTLGSVATRQLVRLFPNHVWLMLHGSASQSKVLYRSRSQVLGNAYEKAVVASTNIAPGSFGSFNAGYVTDKIIDGVFYLKTEVPARIWLNNKNSASGIVKNLETYPFAWDNPPSDLSSEY